MRTLAVIHWQNHQPMLPKITTYKSSRKPVCGCVCVWCVGCGVEPRW